MTRSSNASSSSVNRTQLASSHASTMRSKEEVARDTAIFSPNGLIHFPFSDRNPQFRPHLPVTKAQPSSTPVNYFYPYDENDDKALLWKSQLGRKLAIGHFGLSDAVDWRLASFPNGYLFVEHRKSKGNEIRRDPYLYGADGHRFRSINEFEIHAVWMLRDPGRKKANCLCKYCAGGDEWQRHVFKLRSRPSPSEPGISPTTLQIPRGLRAFQSTSNGAARIRAQVTPRDHNLAGVPVNSTPDRSADLAMIESKKPGECEGFRHGEIVSCTLSSPITQTEDGHTGKISAWPVAIKAKAFKKQVDHSMRGTDPADFDLDGRVTQKRTYKVIFLGTNEETYVSEDRLMPGLVGTPPVAADLSVGSPSSNPWMNDEVSDLNLENGKERAPWEQVLFCSLVQIYTCNLLRAYYSVTDAFIRSQMGPAPSVVNAFGIDEEKLSPKSPLTPSDTSFAGPSNPYMEVDNDDSNARRRQLKSSSSAGISASGAETSTDLNRDTNTYWQGILFGLERIWVGDLVRLQLTESEAGSMIAALARGNNLYTFGDRHTPNVRSPFVLRLKAIYRSGLEQPDSNDNKIRVAGDVYRVIPKANEEGASTERVAELESDSRSSMASRTHHFHSPNDHSSGESVTLTVRPRFCQPVRPFLEATEEYRLPMTPRLPSGFGFQRINQKSAEVVFPVQQISGRLYCSLAASVGGRSAEDLIETVSLEQAKPCEADHDADDRERSLLSLAGLLPGTVKAMNVDSDEAQVAKRSGALRTANTHARAKVLEYIDSRYATDKHQGDESVGSTKARSKRRRSELSETESTQRSTSLRRIRAGESSCNPMDASQSSCLARSASYLDDIHDDDDRESSPELPPNWTKRFSKTQKKYFYVNTESKTTQWSHPGN